MADNETQFIPDIEQAAHRLVAFVNQRGGALMHEILLHLQASYGYEVLGSGHLHYADHPQVVLWANISALFVDIFNAALEQLEVHRANPQMYAFFSDDIGIPALPVVSAQQWAEKKFDFPEQRWLPLVFFVKKSEAEDGQ